jgi:hypothetical protein
MALSSLLFFFSVFLLIRAQTEPTSSSSGEATEGCSKGALFNGHFQSADGSYSLEWAIDCDAGIFSGIMASKGSGWVAWGLNTEAGMVGGHVIQARVVNGSVEHRAGHNIGYQPPETISNDIFRGLNATENSTHTVVGFERPLIVGGENASLLSIEPSGNIMLWALQSTDDAFTTYHSNKAAISINFFTGKSTKPKDYPLIHGALMLLAFGFLAPAGTFVARYLKGIGHPWYLIHMGIQYTLLALMFAAFVIIENDLGPRRDAHFRNPHTIIGLTIVILTFVQVLLGILANAFFKAGREGPPLFPDKAHWWLGRLVILYAFANCFIGFDQYGFTGNHNAPFISFAVWLALVALLFLIAEIITGQTHHVELTDNKFQQFKIPIITYVSMFVLGFILYGVTLHEMYSWVH